VLRKHLRDIEDEINTGILLLFWVGGWDEHVDDLRVNQSYFACRIS
jgi:hypothetical protein